MLVGQLLGLFFSCFSCFSQDLRHWTLLFTRIKVEYERELSESFGIGLRI